MEAVTNEKNSVYSTVEKLFPKLFDKHMTYMLKGAISEGMSDDTLFDLVIDGRAAISDLADKYRHIFKTDTGKLDGNGGAALMLMLLCTEFYVASRLEQSALAVPSSLEGSNKALAAVSVAHPGMVQAYKEIPEMAGLCIAWMMREIVKQTLNVDD